jgi:putative inorganic carbon (hco3(-)) transporter
VTNISNTSSQGAPQRYAWLVWLEPALVLALAPVFLFPSPHRSILLPFMSLLFVLHFLAQRKIVEPSPANLPLMLLLFMVFLSLFATYDISFSLPKIAGVLLGAAAYFAIINFTSSQRLLSLVMAAVLLGTVAFSALALVGTQWVSKVAVLDKITSRLPHWIRGVPGAEEGFYPNAVAGVVILFLPLQIAMISSVFLDHKRNRALGRALLFLSIGVNASVLLLSQSRGGWLGLGVGILLLFAWKYRLGRWLAPAIILAGILFFARLGTEKAGNNIMASIGDDHDAKIIIGMRTELWDGAMHGIADFPYIGMGMNVFRQTVRVIYPLFFIPPYIDVANCHNQFLQTALDLGIPGLIAYIALLAAAIAMGIRVWHRCGQPWIRAAAQGLVCGIIAQQVFGITDAIALGAKVGIFFWIALGLLAAMYRHAQPIASSQASQ